MRFNWPWKSHDSDISLTVHIADKESAQDGVAVHKEQVSHFENNNGEKIQVLAKEEKGMCLNVLSASKTFVT